MTYFNVGLMSMYVHLPKILQGDILLLNCTYRTQTRTGVTLVSPDIGNMFKDERVFYLQSYLMVKKDIEIQPGFEPGSSEF